MPPEQLLLAPLQLAFHGIRSERLLLEQLDDNLLFRWFVGLTPDDSIWHPTTYGLRPTASTPQQGSAPVGAGHGQVPPEADGCPRGETMAQP